MIIPTASGFWSPYSDSDFYSESTRILTFSTLSPAEPSSLFCQFSWTSYWMALGASELSFCFWLWSSSAESWMYEASWSVGALKIICIFSETVWAFPPEVRDPLFCESFCSLCKLALEWSKKDELFSCFFSLYLSSKYLSKFPALICWTLSSS